MTHTPPRDEPARAVFERMRAVHLVLTGVWTQGYDKRDIDADIAIIDAALQ